MYFRDVYEGRRVLEFDSLSGTGADFLARHGASHVTGIDGAPDLVAGAAQKYAGPNLEFHCKDYANTGFEDGLFEVIMVPQGLDMLRRDDWLSEIKRLLAPSGCMILKAPSSDGRSPRGRGATYYEFVERLEPLFQTVRMAAQSPFVAMSVVEYGESADEPEPDFQLETELSELGRGVDVLDYVAICGDQPRAVRGYNIVQLPSSEGVDMMVPLLECLTSRRLAEVAERPSSAADDRNALKQAIVQRRQAERDSSRMRRELEDAQRELGQVVGDAGVELRRAQGEVTLLRQKVRELESRLARASRDAGSSSSGSDQKNPE